MWYQTVPTEAGKTYRFSVWALGTAAGSGGYSLRMDVDDVAISDVYSPTAAFVYAEHAAQFVAGGSSVEVSLKNVSGITFPNDFMLDDLAVIEVDACVADLSGDDMVDITDLLELLSFWGRCDACAADIDCNGVVNTTDLLGLLGAWGDCD